MCAMREELRWAETKRGTMASRIPRVVIMIVVAYVKPLVSWIRFRAWMARSLGYQDGSNIGGGADIVSETGVVTILDKDSEVVGRAFSEVKVVFVS